MEPVRVELGPGQGSEPDRSLKRALWVGAGVGLLAVGAVAIGWSNDAPWGVGAVAALAGGGVALWGACFAIIFMGLRYAPRPMVVEVSDRGLRWEYARGKTREVLRSDLAPPSAHEMTLPKYPQPIAVHDVRGFRASWWGMYSPFTQPYLLHGPIAVPTEMSAEAFAAFRAAMGRAGFVERTVRENATNRSLWGTPTVEFRVEGRETVA